jgi:hypothetical protein
MEIKIGDKIRIKDTYSKDFLRGRIGTVSEIPCNIGGWGIRPHFLAATFEEPVGSAYLYRWCFSSYDFQVLRSK